MSDTTKLIVGGVMVGGLGYIAYSVYSSQHCEHGLDPNTQSCRKDPYAPYTQDELKKVGTDDGAAQTLLGAQGSDSKPIPPGKCGRKIDKNNKLGDVFSYLWDDVGVLAAGPVGVGKAIYDGIKVKCPKPPVDPEKQKKIAEQLKALNIKPFTPADIGIPPRNQATENPQQPTKTGPPIQNQTVSMRPVLSSTTTQSAMPSIGKLPWTQAPPTGSATKVNTPITPMNPKPRIVQGQAKDPRNRTNMLKDATKR